MYKTCTKDDSNFLQILLEIQDFSTIIQVNKDVVRHRTRSGLPVGETDGPRRGPTWQGFRGPAEALLRLIKFQDFNQKSSSERVGRNARPLFV